MGNKQVRQRLSEPFDFLEISVMPISIFGKPGEAGHSVGVMDLEQGKGHRVGIERAEAEARAILKAIRAYKRANGLSPQPSEDQP